MFLLFLLFQKILNKMEAKKVLLAEDDMNLGKVLSTVLTGKGFEVKHANNGEAAFELFCTHEFDICLIDVMMPIKDGFTLAQEIRKLDKKIPIIFLTAKTMQEDMIKGLSIGGDDYITKPFTMEILLARMQALLRRTGVQEEPESHIVNIGNIQFDRKRQVLIVNGEEQKMTSREAALLDMLYEQRNDVLYRSYALKKIWGEDSFYNSRNMDVYITRLRKLLKSEPTTTAAAFSDAEPLPKRPYNSLYCAFIAAMFSSSSVMRRSSFSSLSVLKSCWMSSVTTGASMMRLGREM